jgi:hypothetical protein
VALRGRGGSPAAERAQEDGSREEAGDRERRRRVEAEGADAQQHGQRADREADVAADREVAHAASGAAPGAPRHPRRLGMEEGDAQAAQGQRARQRRVGIGQADDAESQPRDHHAERRQQGEVEAVRPDAEEGLDDRGGDRRRRHQGGGARQVEAAVCDQRGQERRHRALAHVGAAVGEGEGEDRARVDRRRLGAAALPGGDAHFRTPATSRSTTCSRARSGSQRCPRRM